MCIGCDELLTIERILLTCSDLMEIRQSHFTIQSLRVLFQEISPERFLTFGKKSIFFEKCKLEITFDYVCLTSLFKYGFKILHVPILTRIHF